MIRLVVVQMHVMSVIKYFKVSDKTLWTNIGREKGIYMKSDKSKHVYFVKEKICDIGF